MDSEVKQRNRRRKRAQRMQAQRDCKDKDGDSAEDDSPVREKPQRPPNRRKRSKEPLVEEDIIDGFAILGFRTYEDLEAVIKLASKAGIRKLTSNVVEEKLKTEKESQRNLSINNHHITAHPPTQHQGLTLTHDPGTSDDSGRASERLTGSSVAPRDPDSSRDRLSDASSRCSSGKGYICDSEGEDDKGSDAGSVLFASTPSTRKLEFPSALSIGNGDSSASPVPAPTPPGLAPPAPSPAAAALPPPQPPQYSTPSSAATNHGPAPPPPPRLVTPPPAVAPVVVTAVSNVAVAAAAVATPPSSVPVTMPQPAAAPAPVAHLPPALDSTADVNHSRTDSPAVATSANVAVAPGSTSQYPAFPSLYAPYAAHSPYTAPSPAPAPATLAPTIASTVAASMAATVTTTSHRDIVTSSRTHSPRGHSPTRERDSYSSNVSSLSRGSVTPFSSAPPPTTATVSSSLAFSKPTPTAWPTSGAAPPQQQQQSQQQPQQQQRPPSQPLSIASNTAPSSQLSPATSVPRPTPPLGGMHPFPAPMFAPPPLPPPAVSTASPLGLPPNSNPNPFSAESLFQSNQDMLRRELDSRFLASQDRSLNVGPPPYLRTEMHQHQHHHTHVHQHTTPLLPPPPASTLFPTPLFKEIPKMGSVDSPFYRQNIGISSYPGYSPGLLHPGIGGPTPFVPPNHLPTFQPKQPMGDTPKPKPPVKSGKWNAMHVRVAWEIYHHQQKQQSEVKAGAKADMLRPPSHMFPGSLIHSARPHELSFPAGLSGHRPPPTFDHQPHPGSMYSNPASHLVNGTAGSGMSPFSRYGTAFNAPSSPFSMSPFPGARELPPLGPMHDPWSRLQRAVPGFPPAPVPQSPWSLKPDPAVLERREQEERERERERERLRREREERERREREEKQRKQLEQQQQERERERERREKERREMERREMERERERERERMLHQQRIAESKQQAAAAAMAARDRSPLRNGGGDMSEVRVKEEPRTKDDDVVMLSRTTDPRYHHPYLNRHPASLPPHSMLDRSRGMLPPGLGGPPLPSHFPPPPPASHWPGSDPFRDPYRFEPLRYNPLMEAAMRAEEAKLFSAYASHPAHLRGKEPPPPPPAGLMHMRPGPGPGPPPHKICATPPTADMHKKDDSSQSR